jgi:hypothetical protein
MITSNYRYHWSLAADRLVFHLTYRRNRHSQRFLRGDLDYLRRWLDEPILGWALATLFGNGHEAAVDLVLRHRDHMVAAGYSVATINRHLCTLRLAARVAREMGEIDWDLAEVPGTAICDNGQNANGIDNAEADAEGQESRGMAPEIAQEMGCN